MSRRLRMFGPRGLMGIGVHLAQIKAQLEMFRGCFGVVEHFHDRVAIEVRQAIASSVSSDINLFFGDADFAVALKGLKLYWVVFESSRPPPGSKKWLERYDLLVSPSQWGKDCLVQEGLDPARIAVVPEGVDPYRFHPFSRRIETSDPSRPLRFLMMGKYETRKAYKQAFEAFDMAFGTSKDVQLLIKPEWISESRVMMAPDCLALIQRYKHLSIRWVQGLLSEEALSDLYTQVDVFLFPSMGEGWGLPLIEAMACGTPAVCTVWSGQSEYLLGVQDAIWPIPFRLQAVQCPKWLADHHYSDQSLPQWAMPDVAGLAGQLQAVASVSANERAGAGRRASEHVRKHFTWQQAADKFIDLVNTI